MKTLELEDLQQVLLEMMKDIHAFCIANNIKYSLAYGSLIGAIRHKGFIPWDDDIDIWMPRPDYERFCESFKDGRYELKQLADKDYYMGYARVYDKERTFSPENYRSMKNAAGVWIDVLPLDGVSNDKDEREKDYRDACRIRDLSSGFRNDVYYFRIGSILTKIMCLLKMIVKRVTRGSQHKLLEQFDGICKRHAFGSTKFCANYYCYSAYKKRKMETLETDWLKECEPWNFEDTQFMIAKSYHAILSNIFGDYMRLPPEDKRGGFHTATFYWRK